MKTTIITLLTVIGVSALLLPAAAQSAGAPDDNNNNATDAVTADQPAAAQNAQDQASPGDQGAQSDQNTPDQGAMDQAGAGAQETPMPDQMQEMPAGGRPVRTTAISPRGPAPQTVAAAYTPPGRPVTNNPDDLNMDFKNAPLSQVLSYLSDAAGFIIQLDTRANVNGYVTVQGKHITRSEAVDLLNSELNRNNLAAIRNDRILTIVNKNDAITSHIPVRMGSNPTNIPNDDVIATWIIPIRFVDSQQLVSDLSLFVSPQARIVANAAGNSLIITDTQANIRHLAEIIQYVDGSAESETIVRVFPLKYANPSDVASELANVFPSGTSGSSAPITFGGRGGFGRGGFGRGGRGGNPFAALLGGNNANSQTEQRIQKSQQVSAVADPRTQSVIVTAPKDLMNQIADMMTELDVPSNRDQNSYVVQLDNGDPQQVAQVLQSMFGGNNSRNNLTSQNNSALQQREQQGVTTMGQTTTTSGVGGSSGFGGGTRGGGRGF
ncbi:MAG TPA: secretin N-terminal domain-containing protein [Verrucomicrobiae bacterium]|nr:secretin N-terminal domain-containing protein [Verrucomicrobiae bacterium]